jgi:hypothetical protein
LDYFNGTSLAGNHADLRRFRRQSTEINDLLSVRRPARQSRDSGRGGQLQSLAAITATAPQQKIGVADVSCPFPVARELNFSARNAAEEWNELLRLGVEALKLRTLLLSDHEQVIAGEGRQRAGVGEWTSRDGLRIGTGAMKETGLLAKGPDIGAALPRGSEEVVGTVGTPSATTFPGILMKTLGQQLVQAASVEADLPDTAIT